MAFAIEYSRWLYLQFARINITIEYGGSMEVEKILYLDLTGYMTHDIGLLPFNISLHYAPGADDHFRFCFEIAF